MTEYTIPCTEEQTRKALELGVPIEKLVNHPIDKEICNKYNFLIINGKCYISPTSEQLIGWLEHNTLFKCIQINIEAKPTNWMYVIYYGKDDCIASDRFSSRKEATLAAIDAALEYLANNKK